MHHTPHCIVIGGGFAGAAASVALVQAGWRVTLVETRGVAGGRVYSLMDKETGEVIDNGQHLLMGCYHATLRLLDTLGTRHLLRPQEAMRVEFVDCASKTPTGEPQSGEPQFSTLDAGRLPGKAGMALGILTMQGLSPRERWQALCFAAALQAGLVNNKTSRGKTSLELLQQYGQSAELIRKLWEPIILATLNATPAESAATLLVEVLRRAFFSDRESARLLLPRVGLDDVLKPLGAWLEACGSRIIQATASAILYQEPFAAGSTATATGITTMTGERIEADCVISAIPPRSLLKLLPELQAQTPYSQHFAPLSRLEFSPIVSAYLWFDRSFMTSDFVAMLGTTTQWIFNRRAICDAPKEVVACFPGHIATTISASSDLVNAPQEAIIERCIQEIRGTFPAARTAKLLRGRVIKEKFATPLLTPQTEPMRLSASTPVRNLFLAGDWTGTGLPATIESASQSGYTAAEAALQTALLQK